MKTLRLMMAAALLLPASAVMANDYPTLERVDWVMMCMFEHGGQTVDNLYACSCAIDGISKKMSFEEFSEANTYRQYQRMPGEKGGIFRDSDRGEELLEKLKTVRTEAEKGCFLKPKGATAATQ